MERKVLRDLNTTQEHQEESPLLYYTPNKINSQHDQGSTTVQAQGEGQENIFPPADKEANKENGEPAEDVETKDAVKGPRKSVLQLFDPLCDRSVTQNVSSPTATAVTEAVELQQEETFEDACETEESFVKYSTPLQDSVEYKSANNSYKPRSLNETLILEKSNRVCKTKQETGKLLDITFDQTGCVESPVERNENAEIKACDTTKQSEDIRETIKEDAENAEFVKLEAQIMQMEKDSNMPNHEPHTPANEQNNSDKGISNSDIVKTEVSQMNTTFEISQTVEEKQTEDKGIVNAKESDSNENQYYEAALNPNKNQETAQKLDSEGEKNEKCVINCEEVIVLNDSELVSEESKCNDKKLDATFVGKTEESIVQSSDEVIVINDTNDSVNESVSQQEITLNTTNENEVSKCNQTFETSKIRDSLNTTNENDVSKCNQTFETSKIRGSFNTTHENEVSKLNETFERSKVKDLEINPVSECSEKNETKNPILECEKSPPREISEEIKNDACIENIVDENNEVITLDSGSFEHEKSLEQKDTESEELNLKITSEEKNKEIIENLGSDENDELVEESKETIDSDDIKNEHNSSMLEQALNIINKQKMESPREVTQKLQNFSSEQELVKDETLKDTGNVSETKAESVKLTKSETEQDEKTPDDGEKLTPKKLEEEFKNSTNITDQTNVDKLVTNCPADNTNSPKITSDTFVKETLDETRKISISPEPQPNKEVQNEQEVKSPVGEKKSVSQENGISYKQLNLLADEKLKLQSELSKLRLELNEAQQVNANLQLEIRKKEEVILKAETEALQNEQTYKKEIEQLKEQLKNSKGPDKNADLLVKIEDSITNEQKLTNELNKKNAQLLKFQRIMEKYELKLQENAQYLQKLKAEYEVATRHLANTELAFSDVHEKYERSKAVLDVYRNNEDTLKQTLEVNNLRLKTTEEKYDALKVHCVDVQKKYAEDLHKMREKYGVELEKFRAVTKRLEIKCSSLQTSLDQKTQECIELSALCDELTGK